MACADPTAVSGGTLVTSSPYADGSVAVFQCTSGYVMSGTPYITCTTGSWVGTYPTCNLNDDTITINNNSDDFPNWLAYIIAGVIVLLVITCILVLCLQLFGCYEGGGLFGAHRGCKCCCDSRNNSYDLREEQRRECTSFPRRYQVDANGRRFHIDDLGRACYYEHKNRTNHKVATLSSTVTEYPASVHESKTTFVSSENELMMEKRLQPAKEINAWKPHVHHVRSINTSTK